MAGFAGYGCIPARPQIWAAAESSRDRWIQLLAHRVLRHVLYQTVRPCPHDHLSSILGETKQLDMHRYLDV